MNPEPTYQSAFDVNSIVFDQNGESDEGKYSDMFESSVESLTRFMGNKIYRFHSHTSNEIAGVDFSQYSATSPDDITVVYNISTNKHPIKLERIPIIMSVRLHSFKTPVEGLKKELTDVVEQACREIKNN